MTAKWRQLIKTCDIFARDMSLIVFQFPLEESMELERGSRTTTINTLLDVTYEIAFSHCQGSQDLQIIVINSVNQLTSPRQVFPSSLFLLVSVVRVCLT